MLLYVCSQRSERDLSGCLAWLRTVRSGIIQAGNRAARRIEPTGAGHLSRVPGFFFLRSCTTSLASGGVSSVHQTTTVCAWARFVLLGMSFYRERHGSSSVFSLEHAPSRRVDTVPSRPIAGLRTISKPKTWIRVCVYKLDANPFPS